MKISAPFTFTVASGSLGALSGSFTTSPFPVYHLYGFSVEASFTQGDSTGPQTGVGATQVTGTFSLQACNDVVQGQALFGNTHVLPNYSGSTLTNWANIAGSSQNVAAGPGTATQNIFENYGQFFGRYVRASYTHTSGTGSVVLNFVGKGSDV